MDINQNIKETISLNSEHPLLLCIKCQTKIPFISLAKIGHILQVETNCVKCNSIDTIELKEYLEIMNQIDQLSHYCTKNNNHSTIPSLKFCLNCNKWICQECIDIHQQFEETIKHCFLSKELNYDRMCSEHKNKTVKYYNEDTRVLLCNKCCEEFPVDSSATIISFESLIQDIEAMDIDEDVNVIKSIRNKNEGNKNMMIHMLNTKIDEISQLKRMLQEAYEYNDNNNTMILDLLLTSIHNYRLLKTVPSYELSHNIISNWKINNAIVIDHT